MLNGGNYNDTRRRTLKLTLDAVTYSLLAFFFGLVFTPLKNVKILFTDISIPNSIFLVLSILYFLIFFVFSVSLLLPVLMEFIEQILDWAASSALWHTLTALFFYTTTAFTVNCLIQGGVTLPTSVFSLPVDYLAAGWLGYVAIILIVDIIKPDWREAIGNLFGGASGKNSDYLTRQLDRRDDRPAAIESEGTNMRASYLGGGGGGGGINWAFLLTGVFAVVVAGAFGYYYWQSTNTITARNSTIANQTAQIAQLTTDLTNERANSTSLLEQLNSNVTALITANNQILTLNNSVNALNSQINSVNANQATLQSQITTLQSSLATAQAQVDANTAILNLSATASQITNPVSQTFGALSTVVSFNAQYAGYLSITGTSTTNNGYINVSESNSAYPFNGSIHNQSFFNGGTVYVPVLPGSVTVSFGNTDGSGTITANLSVVYYY